MKNSDGITNKSLISERKKAKRAKVLETVPRKNNKENIAEYLWKPGESGNPNGRPNVPNKITVEKREALSKILDVGLKELPSVLKEIKKDKPEVYVKLMLDVASFIIPKKRDITSDDQSIVPHVTINERRVTESGDTPEQEAD